MAQQLPNDWQPERSARADASQFCTNVAWNVARRPDVEYVSSSIVNEPVSWLQPLPSPEPSRPGPAAYRLCRHRAVGKHSLPVPAVQLPFAGPAVAAPGGLLDPVCPPGL